MQLTPLLTVPATPPTGVAAASLMDFVGRDYLRVRLKLTESPSGPVSVRPWYWLDGEWWPLRADAAADVGVKPVTADGGSFSGKADGFFLTGGLGCKVVLVVEDGDLDDIEKAFVDAADAPGRG